MACKQMPRPRLTIGKRWCNGFEVTYPVSYRYNGGTIIDGKWYEGYRVPKPKVPKGFELVSIGCGLQLNARPPYATNYLKPKDDRKKVESESRTILANRA